MEREGNTTRIEKLKVEGRNAHGNTENNYNTTDLHNDYFGKKGGGGGIPEELKLVGGKKSQSLIGERCDTAEEYNNLYGKRGNSRGIKSRENEVFYMVSFILKGKETCALS